jgi:hypothetical protein
VKRNAKQNGSGGRLRLALLAATAAAFLLVPAAQAFAHFPITVEGAGAGSGWVYGKAPNEGNPVIECHWNGAEGKFDFGTSVAEGSNVAGLNECKSETVTNEIEGVLAEPSADEGSLFAGWMTLEGIGLGCEEAGEAALPHELCGVITFGGPVKIKATFNTEPTAPANITPPTISGTAKVGKTLKGNAGTWSGEPAPTFTHQWWRCNEAGEECEEIAGATGTEYEVTEEDCGKTLFFEETATNELGSASAQSELKGPVLCGGEVPVGEEPDEVYGEVPATTSLESKKCEEEGIFLGTFLPGVEKDYENSCTVIATSSGAESALSAADEGAEAVGYLVNGTYSLAQLLEVQGTDTESLGGVSTGFGTMETPYTLLSWAVPVSADTVQVDYRQPIGKHDPLHTGTYSKVITLTLEQTLP